MSFLFGKSSSSPNVSKAADDDVNPNLTSPVYDTGRNIDDIVKGLINSINDSEKPVQDVISQSLLQIGEEEPLLVLSKGLTFLNNTSKSNKQHRVLVMDVMSQTVDKQEEINKLEIPDDLAQALVMMSITEVVAEKSVDSAWQNSACILLISLARLVPDTVAHQLLLRFPTNTPPHFFIVKAFADFAHKYPAKFLPHCKEVLSRALPLLSLLKHDNLRWVFSAALGRWAEAMVICYRENLTNIPKSEFSASMTTALKHILVEWLSVRETKVKLAGAEAIGYMFHIIETENAVALFPKIFQTYLQMLKRDIREQLPIIVGLQNLIFVVVKDCPEILMEHLELTFQTVHANNVAAAKAGMEKNQVELMRYFSIIGSKFTDHVISFLQKNLDTKDAASKIAIIRSFKHIVATLIEELKSYRDVIVSALIPTAKETSDVLIHSEFVKLVEEMGTFDYLSAPGGTDLMMSVIKGCAISDSKIESSAVDKKGQSTSNNPYETLRNTCDEILNKFTTQPEIAYHMDGVLWPFLLETMTPSDLLPAFSIICKAISDIAKRKKDDDDFIIDFDRLVNIPKPNAILAKLLVLMSSPYGRNNPGVNILRALYCLSPNLHAEVVELWSKKLPVMKKYIDATDSYNQDQWENFLLNLIRDTIDQINDDQWTVSLGDSMLAHISHYSGKKGIKKALLSMIGLVIQKATYKEFIGRAITEIVEGTDHSSEEERLGCARGLGQAAVAHTDSVLAKLHTIMKTVEKQKSGGFGGLFGGAKSPSKDDITPGHKATALLTYGYVCMLTPIDLLTSRIEIHVVTNVVPTIRASKTQDVKENGMKAIELIAKAIHPSRIPEFVFKSRDELIKCVLETMNPVVPQGKKPEIGLNMNKIRNLGLDALIALVKLPPKFNLEIQNAMLNGTLVILNTKSDDLELDELLIEKVNTLLSTLLQTDVSHGMLDDILKALEVYCKSVNVLERKRACHSHVLILKEFAKQISENMPTGLTDGFKPTGRVIGRMIPRITEGTLDIRQYGLDAIYVVLRVHYFLKTGGDAEQLPAAIQKLGPLRSQLHVTEPQELFAISKELSVILCEVVDSLHLSNLVETILSVLDDVDVDGARGACVILNALIRVRGQELEKETTNLIQIILDRMTALTAREPVINGLLHATRGLTRHHSIKAFTTLLSQKVPHSPEVKKAIQILSTDKNLTVAFFDYVLDIINNAQLFEDKGKGELASSQIVSSATCALSELLDIADVSESAKDYYASIACTILLRVGSANAVTIDPPAIAAQECFKNFLTCVGDEELLERMEKLGFISKLVGKNYAEGIQDVMNVICANRLELVKEMFDYTKQFIERTFIGTRIAATCMVAVLVYHIQNDRQSVHEAINCLLGKSAATESATVKTFALRGLANLTKQPKDVLHKYVTPVVGALIPCIEDTDEAIIIEAMKAIEKVFSVADDEFIAPMLLNLCIRLKPSFEKQSVNLRENSIKLFGTLARFCKGSLGDALINNIHQSLATLLVHLQDDAPSVINACKLSLRQLVPELGSKSLVELFEKSSLDAEMDFDVFAEKFAEVWVKDFADRISDLVQNLNVFFKSDWVGVCKASCLMSGYILAKINDDQKRRVNLKHVCTGLVGLLKRNSPIIREKAAKMLGLLYQA